MYLTEIEQEIIDRLKSKVTELAETAILALESGEDEFVWALASHTLSPLDREVMMWVRDRLQEAAR